MMIAAQRPAPAAAPAAALGEDLSVSMALCSSRPKPCTPAVTQACIGSITALASDDAAAGTASASAAADAAETAEGAGPSSASASLNGGGESTSAARAPSWPVP